MILRRDPCRYTYSQNNCGFLKKNSHYKRNVLNTNFLYLPAKCVIYNIDSHTGLTIRRFKNEQLINVRNIFY